MPQVAHVIQPILFQYIAEFTSWASGDAQLPRLQKHTTLTRDAITSIRTSKTSPQKPEGKGFVKRSAMLSCIFTYVVCHSYLAKPSQQWWKATLLRFFFNVETGLVVLASTYWLSPNTDTGLSTGMPIIWSLNQSLLTYSVTTVIAQNLLPNVLVSTPPWRFENQ